MNPRSSGYLAYVVLLVVLFAKPLARLALYAADNNIHSHILLVPFISGYLLYSERRSLPSSGPRAIGAASLLAGLGFGAAVVGLWSRESVSFNDRLGFMTLSFVCLLAAGGFLLLGRTWMTAAAFPLGFLVFMVPLPDAVVDGLETASALASAEAAALYFSILGVPLVRHGTIFELPGIVLEVAQECSGIRSSWVLFITSLLASHLFLTTRWRRVALVAFVIPLGIMRNGFRILVIGLLCVHIGPHMIGSVIHQQGGPLFFAVSLVPLFLLLWWLRRQERRVRPPSHSP